MVKTAVGALTECLDGFKIIVTILRIKAEKTSTPAAIFILEIVWEIQKQT